VKTADSMGVTHVERLAFAAISWFTMPEDG